LRFVLFGQQDSIGAFKLLIRIEKPDSKAYLLGY